MTSKIFYGAIGLSAFAHLMLLGPGFISGLKNSSNSDISKTQVQSPQISYFEDSDFQNAEMFESSNFQVESELPAFESSSLDNFEFSNNIDMPELDQFSGLEKISSPLGMEKKVERIYEDSPFEPVHRIVPQIKESTLENFPEYQDYYYEIGRRIKRTAQDITKPFRDEKGQVSISFILTAEGQLVRSQIDPFETFASEFLQRIALKTLDRASPFPPFPEELSDQQMTFNLILDFDLG